MKPVLFLSFLALFVYCSNSEPEKGKRSGTINNSPASYANIKTETLQKRDSFYSEYKKHEGNTDQQQSVIADAQNYLTKDIHNYFEAWYNTPWSFNGTTRTPGEGTIACGYFVTTVLEDMGFRIPRIRWAQMSSQSMITQMNKNIKVFSNKSVSEVEKHIQKNGEGAYLIGLDNHVGFICYYNGNINFIHSNYYQKNTGVMKEKLNGKNPLNDSKYRVIGKIFTGEMTKKWILNEKF